MAEREDQLDQKQRVAYKLEEERDQALDQARALEATTKRLQGEKEELQERLEEAKEQGLAEATRHQVDHEAWQKKRSQLEKQLESLLTERDATETDLLSFNEDHRELERRLKVAEAAAKRERAEVAALRGELGSLKEQVASGNEEGNHMQKIVAAVTREKSRLQAACDLLKEEVSELKDDNAVLQEQITFLGASAMDHESIQTPSHTSSLFAQLSEELAGPEPLREHAEPSGEEESTEASAPGALDETEAPKFIRPWQPPPARPKKMLKILKKKGAKAKAKMPPPQQELPQVEEDDAEVMPPTSHHHRANPNLTSRALL